jgi:8-oxo-dGTP pyrophosphatase MutT (NUDIX family)
MIPRPGKAKAYGGVVLDESGQVLLRAPTGNFGGYSWTFAKGRPDVGESDEATALREVREETGVEAVIVRPLAGWFFGEFTDTRFFLMRCVCSTGRVDAETAGIVWVDVPTALQLVATSRSTVGRARDRAVLKQAAAHIAAVCDAAVSDGGPGEGKC